MAVASVADQIADEQRELAEQGETLLLEIAMQGRRPTYSEVTFFGRLGWSATDVDRQLGRALRVLDAQAIAGDSAQREALDVASSEAHAALATTGVAIQEQIASLQKELAALQSNARNLAKRREDAALAVERLRDNAPPHIRKQYDAERNAVNHTILKRIQELECELHHRQVMGGGPDKHPEPRVWFENMSRSYPEAAVIGREPHNAGRWVIGDGWPALKEQFARDAAQFEEQLVPLREEYEREMARLAGILNYHVN